MQYFEYYSVAYESVLGGMVGEYSVQTSESQSGAPEFEPKYGLKAYAPIAKGWAFSHNGDFGTSRAFGYKRRHLGHDMFGSVGTPVINVETCVVQVLGWNRYGGWRIGMRSLDGRRYYYYAHLRSGHPYATGLEEGQIIYAGEVIGYLGIPTAKITTECSVRICILACSLFLTRAAKTRFGSIRMNWSNSCARTVQRL